MRIYLVSDTQEIEEDNLNFMNDLLLTPIATYRGLTGWFRLLRIFSVTISMSPHVCFILDLIFTSLFLK